MKSEKRTIVITIIGLLCLLFLAGYVAYQYKSPSGFFARENSDIRKVQKNPESPYTDLSGNPIALDSFEGKPLIINIWASWSPFSENELSMLSKMSQQYGNKIFIIAINRMEESSRAIAYLESIGTPTGITYLIDPIDNYYKTVEGFAMPETVFYDSFGNIKLHKRGVITEEELETEIKSLLLKNQ